MEFIGVGLDGTGGEIDEFIAEFGVGGFEQISTGSEPDRVDELLNLYGVESIPYFVFVADDGGESTVVGWDESDVREELAGLQAG